jgi:hypothetical protein
MSDKAEDNLKYGTKKYFKQNFNEYSDIVKDGLEKGLDSLQQVDINVMSRQYNELVESGATKIDKKEAKDKMRSIVKEYIKNKKIRDQGKVPSRENKKLFKDA